ncbi:SDR family oxidoreductase [Motilimonas sp. E26]|uniref:SDR family NAD(P)-dependent oxidoreductase n=1 Tax=Motilimonas sp. E26 TaxID=2865674 RepID=UPI001E5BCC68|nr:SDR family oxidoreductase [Motilimonas sp. E26]MCE0556908.1 SDR family oxidoreductase [Motilimonas sp. E26]
MKTVLITGASRGIGSAMASYFAKQGYRVLINVRQQNQHSDALLQTIKQQGGKAELAIFDITDKLAREQYMQQCPSLDVLINNAGCLADNLLVQTPLTDWQRCMATNYEASCALFELAKPHLLKSKQGCVINMASISGVRPRAGQSAYSVTKSMLIAWTHWLAQQYPQINSFAISPGPVATDMIVNAPWYQEKNAFNRIPLRRFCQPEEIAHAAYCLATHPMIHSGENLIIDGGYTQTTQTA